MTEETVVDNATLTLSEVSEILGRNVESKEDVANYVKNIRSLIGNQELSSYRKVFEAVGIKDMAEVTPEKIDEIITLFKSSEEAKKEVEDLKRYKNFTEEAGIDVSKADPFKINKILNSIDSNTVLPARSAPVPTNDAKIEQLGRAAMKGNRDAAVGLVDEVLGLSRNPASKQEQDILNRINNK